MRVLLLGAFMPLDAYGLVLLYIGIEGLLAATASYPVIKDVLVRQDLKPMLYLRFAILFAVIGVPALLAMMTVGNLGATAAVILLASAFLNGLSQIGLYVLRVADVRAHNRAKIIWSVLTTIMFLALLPLSWLWLPVVYLVGVMVVMVAASHAVGKSEIGSAQEANLAHHLRGWFIYGTLALFSSLPQHGVRMLIAAYMTIEDVARFTQAYMILTAVFFIYSALTVLIEAEMSRAASPDIVRARRPIVQCYLKRIALATAFHFLMILALDASGMISWLMSTSFLSEPILLISLSAFALATGARVVFSALALAINGRSMSLIATVVGTLTSLLMIVVLIPAMGLGGVGIGLALGLSVDVSIILAYLRIKLRPRVDQTPS